MTSLASTAMTMRATVKRSSGSADGYGAKAVDQDWQIVGDALPCLVLVSSRRLTLDGGLVVVEDIRGVFRESADVKVGDRIDELTDRRGRAVLEGILYFDTVTEKSTGGVATHKEASLRRHRG